MQHVTYGSRRFTCGTSPRPSPSLHAIAPIAYANVALARDDCSRMRTASHGPGLLIPKIPLLLLLHAACCTALGAAPVVAAFHEPRHGLQMRTEARVQTTCTAQLVAALANSSIDSIVLDAGTYSPFQIGWSVVIRAAADGAVVLDGQGKSQVLAIFSGTVELHGLTGTGGYTGVSIEIRALSTVARISYPPPPLPQSELDDYSLWLWISGNETKALPKPYDLFHFPH